MPVQHSHHAEQPDVCHWYLRSSDATLLQERKGALGVVVDLCSNISGHPHHVWMPDACMRRCVHMHMPC